MGIPISWTFLSCWILFHLSPNSGFAPSSKRYHASHLNGMKRPILDRIASTLFELETNRVEESSVPDEKGRVGEPLEWNEKNSLANRLSEFMALKGYGFKQFVADIVAGEHDEEAARGVVETFVGENEVAMFSFTSCPFCRGAKVIL